MFNSNGINFCDLVFVAEQVAAEAKQNSESPVISTSSSLSSITLRGAFGLALKQVVCHCRFHDIKSCNECKLRSRCPYSLIFDGVPQNDREMLRLYPFAPQPFVFRDVSLPLSGNIAFTIRLFGPAIDLYPYVIVAVEKMLAKGLGKKRQPYVLNEVSDGQSKIYLKGSNDIGQPVRQIIELVLPEQSDSLVFQNRVRISSKTPIHIRTENRLNEKPSFVDLIKAGMRRMKLMNYFYGNHMEYWPTGFIRECETIKAEKENFQLWSVLRFSGRQERKIPLKGILINAEYSHCPSDAIKFLQSISQIHLGKYGSFGLGQFEVEVLPT